MKRLQKYMRKLFLYFILPITLWVLLSQCLIMRNRWSDKKAYNVFEAKKVPLEIKDTVLQNRHLHYAICGSDTLPTLVFIHGSPGSWMNYMKFMWDEDMRKKYRIVAIDRPGFGYSDFGKAMHLQDQCKLILPVLEKLKTVKPMYLVGHSMGGPIIVKLAADKPNLFSKIVIVAGALDVSQEKKETWRKIMNVKPFYWALPGAFGPSNKELLFLKEDLISLQNDFAKITCSVQFIHGDKDTWVPLDNIAYGKKMMVNAFSISADTIKGADHQIPWKNKDEFTKLLLELY
jgi:pimeloyl-ACP methyl ester carboxylesterase